jgi:hypothetical protein
MKHTSRHRAHGNPIPMAWRAYSCSLEERRLPVPGEMRARVHGTGSWALAGAGSGADRESGESTRTQRAGAVAAGRRR